MLENYFNNTCDCPETIVQTPEIIYIDASTEEPVSLAGEEVENNLEIEGAIEGSNEGAIEEIKKFDYINLDVSYINETLGNGWVGSWKNACEEAVITMIQSYYEGLNTIELDKAKQFAETLFKAQKDKYGSDANSDVKRTLYLIKNFSAFDAEIKLNPSVEEIKQELKAGRPVMAFHYGFDLHNKNIPFLATGSSYHTTLIKGFDDENQVFIVNDPGDTVDGADYEYDYEVFLNSLHDYNYTNSKADGPASVLFTFKKI